MIEKTCVYCGEEFLAARKTAKYCSSNCRIRFHYTKNHNDKTETKMEEKENLIKENDEQDQMDRTDSNDSDNGINEQKAPPIKKLYHLMEDFFNQLKGHTETIESVVEDQNTVSNKLTQFEERLTVCEAALNVNGDNVTSSNNGNGYSNGNGAANGTPAVVVNVNNKDAGTGVGVEVENGNPSVEPNLDVKTSEETNVESEASESVNDEKQEKKEDNDPFYTIFPWFK